MPITLGCPSCGKRFRARDESAGKRVKCPFCQAAVPVPTSDEARSAGAPTETVPAAPPAPVPAATPDEWGTSDPAPGPAFSLLADDPPPPTAAPGRPPSRPAP